MTLLECVRKRFDWFCDDDFMDAVTKWLEEALEITADTEISQETKQDVYDCHVADNERAMFDWIYHGESPSTCHDAAWVTKNPKVFIDNSGVCCFWYFIENHKGGIK